MEGPPLLWKSGNLVSDIIAVESVDVIDGTDFERARNERNRVSYE
jgi:hypothetical protein